MDKAKEKKKLIRTETYTQKRNFVKKLEDRRFVANWDVELG